MRLTRAGVGLCAVAVACLTVGRVFGALELYLLAAMALAVVVLAALYTATAGLDLSVARSATPSRLRVGSPARIDLTLTNNGKRSTSVLRVQDHVGDSGGASLMLAPIRPSTTARVAYRLPSRRRGELLVGPLELGIGDPLGLTAARVQGSGQVTLMVHAELIDLGVLHAVAGNDPTADQQQSRALASGGDEFFALRPYVVGDELRRVNWRASAKTGELVVKQEERPRTGRVTVVLDRRRESYDVDGFERAVSATLSVLYSAWRGDDALRFLTTSSSAYTDIRSRAELNAVDEQLALIGPTESASLVRTVEELSRVGRGGTMVIVTGSPSRELAPAIERARRGFGTVITIVCQDAPIDELGGAVVVHDGRTNVREGWTRAVGRAGSKR